MLDQKTLDRLWNFDDPAGPKPRFREAIADESYDADERAELATQLGRAIGLQGRYEEADALLDSVDGDEPTVGVRMLLERGRVLNSSGHAAMAVPLFEQAAELGGPPRRGIPRRGRAAHARHCRLRPRRDLDPERPGVCLHRPRCADQAVDGLAAQQPRLDAARRRPLTEALVEFQLAEQWAERIGTPRQQELAREAIQAC